MSTHQSATRQSTATKASTSKCHVYVSATVATIATHKMNLHLN